MTAGRSMVKRFKDPVYGYIDVPVDLCSSIVDTPEFQRLRRIVQTSFAPVYPSALHNRFVHSLGVYHLGCLAAEAIDASLQSCPQYDSGLQRRWEISLQTFKLACLLHDFGHAPFSHAGEDLYRENPKYEKSEDDNIVGIDKMLVDIVGDNNSDGFPTKQSAAGAAAHEVMSAILALEQFPDIIPNGELFARCITGYKHPNPNSIEHLLDNILVELLNSKTIDVDKLDYLIRDARTIGFESISIDYIRLLRSARIVWKNGTPSFAFHKSALSVLENVVYARDLEKKWIQSHPVIAYEQFLVKHMARVVSNHASNEDGWLFGKDALTYWGLTIKDGRRIRLMSDDDIIFLAKQEMDADPLIKEYFDRSRRKHPIWKSESEFRMLFGTGATCKGLNEGIGNFAELLEKSGLPSIIDPSTQALLGEDDLERKGDSPWFGEDVRTSGPLRLMKKLEEQLQSKGAELDYTFLTQKSFESGFVSGSLQEIPIIFEDTPEAERRFFREVSSFLDVEGSGTGFFYFYHRRASEEPFPRIELIDILKTAF